jgi:hypothetical protein
MEQYKTYKIDLKHFFSGEVKTIELGKSKTESKEMLKTILKRFSIWWKKSVIYC